MNDLITAARGGEELEKAQVQRAADFLLDEQVEADLKANFLEAMAQKGETAGEIAGFVEAFLERAVRPAFANDHFAGPTIDVCGTGGDKLDLFNVSTTSMFVTAAAGATVIKHGNRGITSKSGGADVLEVLGVPIDQTPEETGESLHRAGVGFLFAPRYHPAFKAVGPVRAKLAEKKQRTLFNLIGPLLNPARPQNQLVGVFDKAWCPVFADILKRLGRKSAWAVNGQTADGRPVDEMSLMGPTLICRSGVGGKSADEVLRPEDVGLNVAAEEDLRGGSPQENAEILEGVLRGKITGPKAEMVALNAGAAIACAGLADDLADGIDQARQILKAGAGFERLKALREST